jgi:predicted HTH domain antitoxin
MLKMSEDEFVEELRFLAAAKLYELGRLTAGKAAQLAEMDRLDFIYRLGTVGVPAINLRDEEVEAEIQAAKDMTPLWIPDQQSLYGRSSESGRRT